MTETVAPLLLVLGQLDLYMDHPPAPEGSRSRRGPTSSGSGSTAASPRTSCPRTCSGGGSTRAGSATSNAWSASATRPTTGRAAAIGTGRRRVDPLRRRRRGRSRSPRTRSACVPIVRVFDRRKPRCRNIGQSRYESIAERQREYYNRDSELILSDTTQAHPLLQGPEDFVQADGTIPIGPSWLLPKKKNTQGGAATYEGFDVVDFPKDGAESIRKNKADIRDDVDRDSALVKPDGPRRRGAVGPVEDDRPRRRQQPPGQDRQDPGPGRAARRRAGAARPRRRPSARPPRRARSRSSTRPSSTCSRPATWRAPRATSSRSSPTRVPCRSPRASCSSRLMRLCLPGLSDAQYAECDAEIETYLAVHGRRVQVLDRPPPSEPGGASPCRALRRSSRSRRHRIANLSRDQPGERTMDNSPIPPVPDGDEAGAASSDDYVTISRAELGCSSSDGHGAAGRGRGRSSSARIGGRDPRGSRCRVRASRAVLERRPGGPGSGGPDRPGARRARPEARRAGAVLQVGRPGPRAGDRPGREVRWSPARRLSSSSSGATTSTSTRRRRLQGGGQGRADRRPGRRRVARLTRVLPLLPAHVAGRDRGPGREPAARAVRPSAAAPKNLGEAIVMKWREESAARPDNLLKPIGLRRHR